MGIQEFIVGQYYSNYDIYKSLAIQNVGGIRPKIENGMTKFIVLTTSAEEVNISFARNPYADRIEGNLLVYTAAGLAGDQTLSGVNKRIVEQYQRPFPIFGFINEGSQKGRRFLGLLELVRHYHETQVDGQRNLRKVWIFEFRIHQSPSMMPLGFADSISEQIIKESQLQNSNEERGEIFIEETQDDVSKSTQEHKLDYISLESLRTKLLSVNPFAFEEMIKDTISRNGFHKVSVTRRSGDGGIDVNGYFDSTHFFATDVLVQFQAKRWKHSVGRQEVAQLRGSLEAPFGVIITTSHFTAQAIRESKEHGQKPIVLVDGLGFSEIVQTLQIPIDSYLAR